MSQENTANISPNRPTIKTFELQRDEILEEISSLPNHLANIFTQDSIMIKNANDYCEKISTIIRKTGDLREAFKHYSQSIADPYQQQLMKCCDEISTVTKIIDRKIEMNFKQFFKGANPEGTKKINNIAGPKSIIEKDVPTKLTKLTQLFNNAIKTILEEREYKLSQINIEIEQEIKERKKKSSKKKDELEKQENDIKIQIEENQENQRAINLLDDQKRENYRGVHREKKINWKEKIIDILNGKITNFDELTKDYVNSADKKEIQSLAVFAITSNNVNLFSWLIDGIDVNFRNNENLSLLALSIKNKDNRIFSQILKHPLLEIDDSAIYTAACVGDIETCKALLNHHLDLKEGNKKANSYEKPIFFHVSHRLEDTNSYHNSYIFSGDQLFILNKKELQNIPIQKPQEFKERVEDIMKGNKVKQLTGHETTALQALCDNPILKMGYSSLMISIKKNPNISLMLLKQLSGNPFAINYTYKKETALSIAAEQGNEKLCRALLKAGASIEVEGHPVDALLIALEKGQNEAAKVLLKSREGRAKHQGSKLVWTYSAFNAINKNDVKAFDQILGNLVDFQAKNSQGYTLLQVCVLNNRLEMAKKLLEKPIDVNQASDNLEKTTALYLAVKANHEDFCRLLLSQGANVDCHIHIKWYESISRKKSIGKSDSALITAAKNNSTPIVKLLIAHITDPATVNYIVHEKTALSIAVSNGNYDICELLIEKEANIELGNVMEVLAQLDSVDKEKIQALLTRHGAKMNHLSLAFGAIKNKNNDELAFYLQRNKGNYDFFSYLDTIDINAKSVEGYTLLQQAVLQENIQATQLLLDNGADINILSSTAYTHTAEKTALFFAIEKNSPKIVELLLRYGADPECYDFEKISILLFCVKNYILSLKFSIPNTDLYKIIRDLYKVNSQNYFNSQQANVLHAIYLAHQETRNGRNFNSYINTYQQNALSICKHLIETLAQKKPSILNCLDEDCKTALFIAAEQDCIELVELLVNAGADPSMGAKNASGDATSPFQVAISKGNHAIASLLTSNVGVLPQHRVMLSRHRVN